MNIYILRRYLLFLVSLFVNALGVAFITKASLGTSPITGINYVLSMFTPLTMGEWTMIVNILFVIFELPLMSRALLKSDLRTFLSQIPISLCFGFFIDLSMNMLYWLEPYAYIGKVAALIAGCMILAAGIALEVKANIAMMAGEYFVKVISLRFKKDFGYVKLGFDITLVALACIVSIMAMSEIRGIREGTVTAALIVGPIVHFISPYYRKLDKWIAGEENRQEQLPVSGKAANIIITLAREYGSGGHLLGEQLSKELGIKLYDKELITLAAQESGINRDYILKNEQSIPSFWLKCITSHNGGNLAERNLSRDDVLFLSESRVIQKIAGKESCIIVGRCADFVLNDYPNAIKVFCHSDFKSALERCVNQYGVPAGSAGHEIKRVNRNRIAHYEYYTGRKWGDPHNYDITVNTGQLGLDTACKIIKDIYEARLKS